MGKRILPFLVAVLLCITTSVHSAEFIDLNDIELAFTDTFDYEAINLSEPIVPWKGLRTYDSSKTINIVYVSGSKYQHYTFTSLISVLENSRYTEREEPIRFTIIYEEMGPGGKQLFKGTLDDSMTKLTNALFYMFDRDTYKYDLEYIPIPEKERECINQFESYSWPKNIFLKLFFSRFLPYDRCIYLDGDTICTNDIREMWNIDLGKHCFGGFVRHWDNVLANPLTVNAGSLLCDLKEMRDAGFADKVEKTLRHNQKNASHPVKTTAKVVAMLEEGVLYNYSKKYGYCEINLKFNTGIDFVPKGLIDKSKKDGGTNIPTIIHYYGSLKPYRLIPEYEAAGCPSYADQNQMFWKETWKFSPWAFVQWYKYYQSFLEAKALAEGS